MADLVKKANAGKDQEIPDRIITQGQRAIYHLLNNIEKTLACDRAIKQSMQEGFRSNPQKQREIQGAIYEVVQDEKLTLSIYSLVENNREDYGV